MSTVAEVFDEWFSRLSSRNQDKLIAHILEKEGIGPVMEGLFSGAIGKVEGGVQSGPVGATSARNRCRTCGKPL